MQDVRTARSSVFNLYGPWGVRLLYGLRGVQYLIIDNIYPTVCIIYDLIYDSTSDETVERRRNQETQVVYGIVRGKLLAFPIWRNRNLTMQHAMQSQSGDAITDAITLVIASPTCNYTWTDSGPKSRYRVLGGIQISYLVVSSTRRSNA